MSSAERGSSESLGLLDIVFTAVLTIGLTPEVLNIPHITGIMSEPWIKSALSGQGLTPNIVDVTHLVSFSTGVSTLLLSWIGLHRSLQARPLKENIWGTFRFVLDVALVFSFGVVLLFFRQIEITVAILAVIYSVFVLWDFLKFVEYRGDSTRATVQVAMLPIFRREYVSAVFAILFWWLWLCSGDALPLATITVALALTFLYRVAKDWPIAAELAAVFLVSALSIAT